MRYIRKYSDVLNPREVGLPHHGFTVLQPRRILYAHLAPRALDRDLELPRFGGRLSA